MFFLSRESVCSDMEITWLLECEIENLACVNATILQLCALEAENVIIIESFLIHYMDMGFHYLWRGFYILYLYLSRHPIIALYKLQYHHNMEDEKEYLFNLLLKNAMEAELTLLHWCLRGWCSLFSDHQQIRNLCNTKHTYTFKKGYTKVVV